MKKCPTFVHRVGGAEPTMKHLLPILLLTACATADEKRDPAGPDRAALVVQYQELSARLLRDHTENGWIVSRENGQPRHQGDSLLWTGIAMAATTCEDGQIFADRMRTMLKENAGALVRYEPLPENYKDGNEISFDGATGLYFGILARLVRCPSNIADWDAIWPVHLGFLERNYEYLHPNSTAAVEPPFNALRDIISHKLGRGDMPGGVRLSALEAAATGWAYAVVKVREPAFRIHLAWLYMRSLERVNALSEGGRNGFCAAAKPAKLPLVEIWCGRMTVTDWDFKLNEFEYASQRGAWEKPDGKGYETPGLDRILALREALDDSQH